MWETINLSIDTGASLLGAYSKSRLDSSKKELDTELTAIKKTAQYRIAQRRGDDKTMERLENKVKKRHIKAQQDEFKFNQKVAAGKIIIDFLVAMAKEYGMKGIWGGIIANKWLALQSAIIVGAVMAQPMPTFAQGGDFVTAGPEMIMVGDNPSGVERVQITPSEKGSGGGSVIINISAPLVDDTVIDHIVPAIEKAVSRGQSNLITA